MEGQVGVDIGGTFTDVVRVENGEISVEKVPSRPDAPERGIIDGIEAAGLSSIEGLVHGTTVATNAVLEGEWARTGLITTRGFRDVLEIARGDRPSLYDLNAERPDPVVPRNRRFEVDERVTERGAVETPLQKEDIDDVIDGLDTANVESVAIALLFSFENDEHERLLADAISERRPDLSISRSSVILPEIREYERTLTTALNAALKPIMDRYLGGLESEIQAFDPAHPVRIMQSNGGTITASRAREQPITTLLSGPAAGVQAAAHIGDQLAEPNLITMDMGGTSCDVSLVESGEPTVSTELELGGYPIGVPMVAIHTIGAGGGSIGWVDDGGAMRVGPRSAGAEPGPICYGRGGDEPTVTDAHALLHRIDPSQFLGGDMRVSSNRIEQAFRERLADPLGLTVRESAAGMLRIANANMERAIRVVSVERGHDPRNFALLAYGGAGPLHATRVADMLDIPRVVIPRSAGVLSALGLVLSDVVHDFSSSHVRAWSELDADTLKEYYAHVETEARQRLSEHGFSDGQIGLQRTADLRYRGQSFTLSVEMPDLLDSDAMDSIVERFHATHDRRYGHDARDSTIELVTLRLRARGRIDPPGLQVSEQHGNGDAQREERDVWFDGREYATPIVVRARLSIGDSFEGPVVIEGEESTILIRPGQRAHVDEWGSVIVETNSGGRAR